MDDVLYECDPALNTGCRKTSCLLVHHGKLHGCELTRYPEYAKKDSEGKPIVSEKWRKWMEDKKRSEMRKGAAGK